MVSCCSLKSFAIFGAAVAVLVKVVNPLLDSWIDPPLDIGKPKQPYNPDADTDIIGYPDFGFVNVSHVELNLGLTYLLQQSFPRWFVALLKKGEGKKKKEKPLLYGDSDDSDYVNHPIDILDARRRQSDLDYKKTGFTLLQMDPEGSIKNVQNWRSQEDIKQFQQELEPQLRELYPDATRIEFTYSVVRGGTAFGDQPAAINAPHLDYSQNFTARQEFHKIWPPFNLSKEHHVLLGKDDTDHEELSALLGIWKPIMMKKNPVCDHPMAIMDASTFGEAEEQIHPVHIDFGFFTFHNLNGAIRYHPQQKWYYYPFQTESEVLVFTQYSNGKRGHFCNPHASFENPNCPEDYETRVSVEMRVAIFAAKKEG